MNTGVVVDQVFVALSDPTRREMLEWLAGNGQTSASAMARELPVSRQAIARHLRILDQAGLVTAEKQGRERRFRVEPRALLVTARWMERAAERWDERLSRIKAAAESLEGSAATITQAE